MYVFNASFVVKITSTIIINVKKLHSIHIIHTIILRIVLIDELQMSFQDVVFLPSRGCFSPHFLDIVVEVTATAPPTCLKTVVECKQGHAPCEIL